MLNELLEGGRQRLHIYLKHDVDEPKFVEAVPPHLLPSDLPAELDIHDYELRDSQVPDQHDSQVPHQAAQQPGRDEDEESNAGIPLVTFTK